MAGPNFDDYAAQYNRILGEQLQTFEPDDEYFAEYKVQMTHRLVRQRPRTILDFGCGVGRSMPYFAKYFPASRLVGCDVSEQSLEYARSACPYAEFYTQTHLETLQQTYDLIFVACVFHHIPPADRPSVASWLARALAPGADLVVFEHNPWNPVTRHMVNTCPFDAGAVLLPPRELKQCCAQAGLRIAASGYTLFFPAVLKWLRPVEAYLRRVPFGGQYFVHAASRARGV